MRFADYFIADIIKENLEGAGYRRPTDIQFKAIPSILKGEDVLAIAQTGTGKTAAFVIPVMHLLLTRTRRKTKGRSPRCLVMVPTHELAVQVAGIFQTLGRGTAINVLALHGGVGQDAQINTLEAGIDILVTTPGRMFDLHAQGKLDLGFVEILILDEADHMLDLGFIRDIRSLVRLLPKKKQTLFFSATINDSIKQVAYSLVHKPIRIQLSPKDPVSKNVEHCLFYSPPEEKRFYLEKLIRQHSQEKILVFVRTRVRAERVARAMERVEIPTLMMHGGLDQKERTDALRRFREGEIRVMIATDVSGRGIDIPGIGLVVNYDLPEQPEYYVHRVGRTGRGDQKGLAISFCSEEEREVLTRIESWLGHPVAVLRMSDEERDSIRSESGAFSEDIQSLLREIEEIEQKSKTRKKK